MQNPSPYRFHLAALFSVIVWGATFVSTKVLISNGLSPAEIFLLRFSMAYIGILPWPAENASQTTCATKPCSSWPESAADRSTS